MIAKFEHGLKKHFDTLASCRSVLSCKISGEGEIINPLVVMEPLIVSQQVQCSTLVKHTSCPSEQSIQTYIYTSQEWRLALTKGYLYLRRDLSV